MSTVRCLLKTCPWSFTGTAAECDTEARRHVGSLAGGPVPGHPVTGSTRPEAGAR